MKYEVTRALYQAPNSMKQVAYLLIRNRELKLSLGIERTTLKGKGWGEMNVHRFKSLEAGEAWMVGEIKSCVTRQYSQQTHSNEELPDQHQMTMHVGPSYWFKLGDHAAWISPEADVTGVTANKIPNWRRAANGDIYDANAQAPRLVPDLPINIEEEAANVPGWGEF